MIKEIVEYAIQVCHYSSIVHRELKPENVLFQTKNIAFKFKVVDFGLSKFFKHGKALTDVVGTLMYTPSKVLDGHHGPKVKLWSIGKILYTLLVGF